MAKPKRAKACWQEVEKEVILLQKLLERLPEEDKVSAAIRIIVDVAIFGGYTTVESIGIFEAAKYEFLKFNDDCRRGIDEEDDDAD